MRMKGGAILQKIHHGKQAHFPLLRYLGITNSLLNLIHPLPPFLDFPLTLLYLTESGVPFLTILLRRSENSFSFCFIASLRNSFRTILLYFFYSAYRFYLSYKKRRGSPLLSVFLNGLCVSCQLGCAMRTTSCRNRNHSLAVLTLFLCRCCFRLSLL